MIILTGPDGNRMVEPGVPYRLMPGERVTGSTRDQNMKPDNMDRIGDLTKTGAGDVILALTKTSGFKGWWDKFHGGDCLPCKKRQAALNYIEFQGPKWLSKWVKDNNG